MDYTLHLSKWLLLIVVLSILGLNIFNYLANVTEKTGEVIKTGIGVGLDGTKRTVSLSGKGVTGIAGVVERGLDDLEKTLDIKVEYEPSPNNDDTNNIQLPKKSGYCYVGTDRNFRSCVYVGRNDTCMSGEIFPTIDVCINPKLRV